MSKKSAKPAGPVTRKQQIAAALQLKGKEIAANVAMNIREAVKQEVETQLKAIKDTMMSLIDRVTDIEEILGKLEEDVYINDRNSDDRPEGEEAPSIPQDDEVVPGPCHDGDYDLGQDDSYGASSG